MIIGADMAVQTDPTVRQDILAMMDSWGSQSIRLRYPWARLEPTKGGYDWAELDALVSDVGLAHMTTLLMLHWAPEWSSGTPDSNGVPGGAADYGTICGLAAQRYGAALAGIEMWERPDDQDFWAGSQDDYITLLSGAFAVARGIEPLTTYLAGAPTYLGLDNDWFATAFADPRYRPGTTHDAQAIQPFMDPADLPPDAPATGTSITGIADLQALRAPYDDSPLWATAFGWSTHTGSGGINEIQQAEYTARAYEAFGNDYTLAAVYVHTAIDLDPATAGMTAQQINAGLLEFDGTPKPVLHTLTEVFATRFDPPPEPPPTEEDFRTLEQRVADLEARVTALEAAATP